MSMSSCCSWAGHHPHEFSTYTSYLKWPPNEFTPIKQLASAIHGTVILMQHIPSNKLVVVKKMTNQSVAAAKLQTESPVHEIGALWYLSFLHQTPFTLNLIDAYKDQKHTYLLTEPCLNGELFEYAANHGPLPPNVVKQFTLQILLAIFGIHSAHACHRDVSLENILLHSDKTIRIMDFGQAALTRNKDGSHRPVKGPAGKNMYRPPEAYGACISGPGDPEAEYDGKAADMFAVGVCIFLMVAGAPPWEYARNSDEHYKYVKQVGGFGPLLVAWGMGDKVDARCVTLMDGLCREDPRSRFTVEEALEHEWFEGAELRVPALNEEERREWELWWEQERMKGLTLSKESYLDGLKVRGVLGGWGCGRVRRFVRGDIELEGWFVSAATRARSWLPHRTVAEKVIFGEEVIRKVFVRERKELEIVDRKKEGGK